MIKWIHSFFKKESDKDKVLKLYKNTLKEVVFNIDECIRREKMGIPEHKMYKKSIELKKIIEEKIREIK